MEADIYCKRVLEIKEKIFGPNHSETILSLHNLAGLYAEQGKNSEALFIYKKILEIAEKVYGKDSAPVAEVLEKTAKVVRNCEDEGRAKKLEDRAKKILAKLNK
jgi:tetratricopeptide (TPR) repeat protein